MSFGDDPQHWNRLAAEARRVAGTLKSQIARQHMLNCAEAYERLGSLAAKEAMNGKS